MQCYAHDILCLLVNHLLLVEVTQILGCLGLMVVSFYKLALSPNSYAYSAAQVHRCSHCAMHKYQLRRSELLHNGHVTYGLYSLPDVVFVVI